MQNALGYGGSNWVQNITINGGFLTTGVDSDNGWETTITMTGGTMNTTVAGGYFAMGTANAVSPPTFNIMPSTVPSLISANLTDRGDNGSPGIVFNVTRGSAASDLNVTGSICAANGGTAGITLNGNGIVVFTGTNTYTGPTTIYGGLLQLGNGTPGSDGALTATSAMLNNGELVYAIAGTQTAAYPISGNGSLFMTGTGTVILTASNGYTGSTTVNAGKLYFNGPSSSVVTVNAGTFGGRGSSPGVSVATGAGIEGGYNGVGTLALGSLQYNGSGTFTTNGYASYPAFAGALPLNVTSNGGLTTAGNEVIYLGGPAAGFSGTYHLIQYSGAIGGSGFGAFVLVTFRLTLLRGQVSSVTLVNDPGYVDVSVTVTPVALDRQSLHGLERQRYALRAVSTGPMPAAARISKSETTCNSTIAPPPEAPSPSTTATSFPAASRSITTRGHPYTLTGLNGIGGSGGAGQEWRGHPDDRQQQRLLGRERTFSADCWCSTTTARIAAPER